MSHVHTLEHTNSNEERSFLIAKVGGGGGREGSEVGGFRLRFQFSIVGSICEEIEG